MSHKFVSFYDLLETCNIPIKDNEPGIHSHTEIGNCTPKTQLDIVCSSGFAKHWAFIVKMPSSQTNNQSYDCINFASQCIGATKKFIRLIDWVIEILKTSGTE